MRLEGERTEFSTSSPKAVRERADELLFLLKDGVSREEFQAIAGEYKSLLAGTYRLLTHLEDYGIEERAEIKEAMRKLKELSPRIYNSPHWVEGC